MDRESMQRYTVLISRVQRQVILNFSQSQVLMQEHSGWTSSEIDKYIRKIIKRKRLSPVQFIQMASGQPRRWPNNTQSWRSKAHVRHDSVDEVCCCQTAFPPKQHARFFCWGMLNAAACMQTSQLQLLEGENFRQEIRFLFLRAAPKIRSMRHACMSC